MSLRSARLPVAALLAAVVLAAAPAAANDSSAELGAGGLVLGATDAVEMRSEDLFVSTRAVRVRYRFAATTDKDVTTLVAFPLPDLTGAGPGGGDIAIPDGTSPNFVDFRTIVDGKPVEMQVEMRASAVGIDRTDLLKGLGLPLNPMAQATIEAVGRLPRERWDELIRLGLASIDTFDAGQGMADHLIPRWTLRTVFYWQQTFPAGRELTVEHSYRPVVGYSAGTGLAIPDAAKEDWYKEYLSKYCMDRTFLDGVRKAGKELREARIEYILTTGANWAGPIKDFRLVVDKGEAGNLVSFCGEGVRKIGPTQFEVRRTDYTPTRNLSVLLVGPDLSPP